MKVQAVRPNNHRKGFEVQVGGGVLWFPYAKLEEVPATGDGVVRAWVDDELGGEGFSYELASGGEGTVHVEQVLEYNQDPGYLRDLLLYRLTVAARKRVEASGLSKREIARRLGTSPTQLYRLLDTTHYGKSVDSLLSLLHILDCDVDLVVRARSA